MYFCHFKKGKLILCPKKTSARYLLDKWLAALGLEEKDVKIGRASCRERV